MYLCHYTELLFLVKDRFNKMLMLGSRQGKKWFALLPYSKKIICLIPVVTAVLSLSFHVALTQ